MVKYWQEKFKSHINCVIYMLDNYAFYVIQVIYIKKDINILSKRKNMIIILIFSSASLFEIGSCSSYIMHLDSGVTNCMFTYLCVFSYIWVTLLQLIIDIHSMKSHLWSIFHGIQMAYNSNFPVFKWHFPLFFYFFPYWVIDCNLWTIYK